MKRYKVVRRVLIILTVVVLCAGIWCKHKSGELRFIINNLKHNSTLKVRTVDSGVEDKPKILLELEKQKGRDWGHNVATDEELRGSSMITYIGESGIVYTFGVVGTDLEEEYFNSSTDEMMAVALNPRAESSRRVGFFVRSSYGNLMIGGVGGVGDVGDVGKVGKVGCCLQLNNGCVVDPTFKNNKEPGLIICYSRTENMCFKGDSWDIKIVTFDLDTRELLDKFVLDVEELNGKGDIVDISRTSLSGWWVMQGAHDMKDDVVEDMGRYLNEYGLSGDKVLRQVSEQLVKQAVSGYNSNTVWVQDGGEGGEDASNSGGEMKSGRVVDAVDVDDILSSGRYFVEFLDECGYCPNILYYNKVTNKFESKGSSNLEGYVAVTAVCPAGGVGGYMTLRTFYILIARVEGVNRFIYYGYTDYLDPKCVNTSSSDCWLEEMEVVDT